MIAEANELTWQHGSVGTVRDIRLRIRHTERLRPRGKSVTVVGMEYQNTEIAIPRPPYSREHIEVMPGHCGGKAHVAGHRIKVQHIAAWHERLGRSPDEIVAEHPGLTLADVYAALAYYYDHRDEIDADIRADAEFAAGLMSNSPFSLLRQKLS